MSCEIRHAKVLSPRLSFLVLIICAVSFLISLAQGDGGDSSPANIGKIQPKCNVNTTGPFCDSAENYPAMQLEMLLKRDLNRYMELFGADLLPSTAGKFDQPGEESLCESTERLIYPQSALNKDADWRFIVNHQKFQQGVRIEECSNTGSECHLTKTFPKQYKTECRQMYIYRPLLATPGDGTLKREQFLFPSSCKCVLRNLEDDD